jgi:hypothetical protein
MTATIAEANISTNSFTSLILVKFDYTDLPFSLSKLAVKEGKKFVYHAGLLFSYYERSFLGKFDSDISDLWCKIEQRHGEGNREVLAYVSYCIVTVTAQKCI